MNNPPATINLRFDPEAPVYTYILKETARDPSEPHYLVCDTSGLAVIDLDSEEWEDYEDYDDYTNIDGPEPIESPEEEDDEEILETLPPLHEQPVDMNHGSMLGL